MGQVPALKDVRRMFTAVDGTLVMICFYFTGWATEDELLNHLAKLKPQI